VTGEPKPSIEWLINGKSLVNDTNQKIEGSTLHISEVEKKHAGIVQCVANNKYGSHSGYNLLRVNPKQHVLGGTTESRLDYGTIKHKHTKGGGRRRNKEGKKKGAGYLPYVIIISYVFLSLSNIRLRYLRLTLSEFF